MLISLLREHYINNIVISVDISKNMLKILLNYEFLEHLFHHEFCKTASFLVYSLNFLKLL